ncbi:hypothetical protein COCNU_10G002510 [Cocos nucifera]|uniref:Uncharacterized protein n=1 Tax=Cocos nucifera TaxID=13894 RepID=A0A8K0ILZ8_COCNU|nr:hypothetical protein COCNU_10G002510 [Cocos nucifera]
MTRESEEAIVLEVAAGSVLRDGTAVVNVPFRQPNVMTLSIGKVNKRKTTRVHWEESKQKGKRPVPFC